MQKMMKHDTDEHRPSACIKSDSSRFLDCLLDMGSLLLDCGAEVSRVEDTLNRMGAAYGTMRTDAFVIPSMISISVTFPGETLTETRRISSGGSTDLYRLEKLNALSREYCAGPFALEELEQRLRKIASGKKPRAAMYLGSALAAGGFALFFGGAAADALAAGAVGLLICFLQEQLDRTQLKQMAFNLLVSLLVGLGVGGLTRLLPTLHMDKILIGDIMLLIPGLAMTNAVRNMLVGDTISGVIRLAETLVWAGALAGGFMVAMLALNILW